MRWDVRLQVCRTREGGCEESRKEVGKDLGYRNAQKLTPKAHEEVRSENSFAALREPLTE